MSYLQILHLLQGGWIVNDFNILYANLKGKLWSIMLQTTNIVVTLVDSKFKQLSGYNPAPCAAFPRRYVLLTVVGVSAYVLVFYEFATAFSVHVNLTISKESENIGFQYWEAGNQKLALMSTSKSCLPGASLAWRVSRHPSKGSLVHLSLNYTTRNLYFKINQFKCEFFISLKKKKTTTHFYYPSHFT